MSEDSRIWDPWSSKAKVKHIQMSKLGHFTKSVNKGFIHIEWIQGPVNNILEQLAPNKKVCSMTILYRSILYWSKIALRDWDGGQKMI